MVMSKNHSYRVISVYVLLCLLSQHQYHNDLIILLFMLADSALGQVDL